MNSVENLKQLGDLVSAVNVDTIDVKHMDEVMQDRPRLIRQLSKSQKVILFSKVFDLI